MKTENLVDKSKWANKNGPWMSEPDRAQWIDDDTSLHCGIHRNDMGALCGYVGVDGSSIYYRAHCTSIAAYPHGGLTYCGNNFFMKDDNGNLMEGLWLIGFDCAHSCDLLPGIGFAYSRAIGNDCADYKDFEFVKGEVKRLALQLSEGGGDI